MAKADMSASAIGISGLPLRGSVNASKQWPNGPNERIGTQVLSHCGFEKLLSLCFLLALELSPGHGALTCTIPAIMSSTK